LTLSREAAYPKADVLFENLILALGILFLGMVSSVFTYSSEGPSIMYLPLGAGFAVLLTRGESRWPGLLIGLMAESYLLDQLTSSFITILLADVGMVLSVLIGTRMVKRYGCRGNSFSSLKCLFPILVAMVLVVPVLSTVANILTLYMEVGSLDDLTYLIVSRLIGTSLGTAVMFPMLFSMSLYQKKLDSNLDAFGAVPIFMILAAVSVIMFNQFSASNIETGLVLSVLIIPLVLLAVNYAGLFGGSMGIFLIAVGMVNTYSSSAASSADVEFWSTIILQVHLMMLMVVSCIYYSIIRESKDNLMEVNHRVRNNLLLVISLVKLQACSVKNESSSFALDDVEDRLIVMSTVCDAQHEHGYGTANFAKIMKVLQHKMSDWPTITGNGWDLDLELERANLAGLIVNEVAMGSFRYNNSRPLCIDMCRGEKGVIMSIDLNRQEGIRSLNDQGLMLLRQILMRHPKTEISWSGSVLRITLPEGQNEFFCYDMMRRII